MIYVKYLLDICATRGPSGGSLGASSTRSFIELRGESHSRPLVPSNFHLHLLDERPARPASSDRVRYEDAARAVPTPAHSQYLCPGSARLHESQRTVFSERRLQRKVPLQPPATHIACGQPA